MEIYFSDYEEGTFDEDRKIATTLMNMGSGEGSLWAQPLLSKVASQEHHVFLKSWDNFKNAFLVQFSDPNKKEQSMRELSKLVQTKSAQHYASQFRILIQELGWNDTALIDKFKEGLKPEV